MNSADQQKHWATIAVLTLMGCWVALQLPHLILDPWNDELYTLQHFAIVPLFRTVTDYHVPNNHILFSLLLNIWRRLGGVEDIHGGIAAIVFLRTLALVFSTATVFVVFRTATKIGGVISGIITGILLISSVPFYNYGCQLRGYGLGMLLFAVLVQEFLRSRPRYVLLALISASIVYTVPSNVYLLLVIAVFAIVSPGGDKPSRVKVPLAIFAGVGMAALAYLPVFSQLSSFNDSRSSGMDTSALTVTAPRVAFHFLSGRWLLLMLPAAYIAVRVYHRSFGVPERLMFFSLVAFCGPFLLSAIRGDGAPDRIYLSVLPMLCLSWGVASGRAIDGLRGILRPGALWLSIVLCGFALLRGEWVGEEKAMTDRLHGERCADLYFQYYLHGYHPRREAAEFVAEYDPSIRVVNACRMDTELPKYLQMAGVPVLPSDSIATYSARRQMIYAVVDGMQLRSAALDKDLRIVQSMAVFTLPSVVLIRWTDLMPDVEPTD